MHPNKTFHNRDEDENLEFAQLRGFGVLVVDGAGSAPLAAHLPFVVDRSKRALFLHLVGSNPIVPMLREEPRAARMIVSGPDCYVSPDWYGVPDQVPTWNYVAVHISGRLALLPEYDLRTVLESQSAHLESQLAPKQPWTLEKVNAEHLTALMAAITPATLQMEAVEGTWKHSQNKIAEVRERAARGIETSTLGMEVPQMAALMRGE